MPPQRATLITLGVQDLAKSKAFYTELGWVAHSKSQSEIVFYQMHGIVLGLFGARALAEDQGRPEARLGHGVITLAINCDTQQNVDQDFAKALTAGATFLRLPQPVFWGGYSGYYADPDGHFWEIAFNPFWPLNPDGSLILPKTDTTISTNA